MVGYLTIWSVIALAVGVGPAAAGDRPGAEVASLCASCHRLDNKPNGIPPIISLGHDQIVAMMKGFRAGTRPSHIMYAVSRSLSDSEIVAVADYLAGLAEGSNR